MLSTGSLAPCSTAAISRAHDAGAAICADLQAGQRLRPYYHPINITSPIHDPLHEHALRLTHASIPEPVALAQTVSQEDELAGGGGGRAAAVLHLSEPRRLFLAAAVCPLLSAGRTGP